MADDKVPIGMQVTKVLKFRKPYPLFSIAPQWEIVNQDGLIILTGSSLISQTQPDAWDVTFTVPTTYESSTSNDTLYLEVFGLDVNGQMRSTEMTFSLLDTADDFLPTGVLVFDDKIIRDSLILERPDITSIVATITDYLGTYLAKNLNATNIDYKRVANLSDVPDRFTEHDFRGYRYDFELPAIKWPKLTRSAYQISYTVTSGNYRHEEIHSAYRVSPRFIDYIQKLKMYLDKARLIEIDPTLQWKEDELCEALINGLNHINGHPAVFTFWTIDDIPLPMSSYVVYAAAFYALNARYLAEGFNSFDFQGLSTSLNFDRKEAITYKIEELKAYLDTNLTMQKANAIQTFGKGTPDQSVTSAKKDPRGITAIQPSLVTNRVVSGYGNFRRYI